jgi:hypothetical protein
MTPEQASWLRTNKQYRAVPTNRGGVRYIDRKILHADGTTDAIMFNRYPPIRQGSFEVGIIDQASLERQS